MRLTRAERETVIRWDEEDREVHIWSSSPVVWRKLARWGLKPVRETSQHGEPSGRFFKCPLAGFRWGAKRKFQGGGFAKLGSPAVSRSGGGDGAAP